jgi:hypothetical protein
MIAIPLKENEIDIDNGLQIQVRAIIIALNKRKNDPLFAAAKPTQLLKNAFHVTDGDGSSHRALFRFSDEKTATDAYYDLRNMLKSEEWKNLKQATRHSGVELWASHLILDTSKIKNIYGEKSFEIPKKQETPTTREKVEPVFSFPVIDTVPEMKEVVKKMKELLDPKGIFESQYWLTPSFTNESKYVEVKFITSVAAGKAYPILAGGILRPVYKRVIYPEYVLILFDPTYDYRGFTPAQKFVKGSDYFNNRIPVEVTTDELRIQKPISVRSMKKTVSTGEVYDFKDITDRKMVQQKVRHFLYGIKLTLSCVSLEVPTNRADGYCQTWNNDAKPYECIVWRTEEKAKEVLAQMQSGTKNLECMHRGKYLFIILNKEEFSRFSESELQSICDGKSYNIVRKTMLKRQAAEQIKEVSPAKQETPIVPAHTEQKIESTDEQKQSVPIEQDNPVTTGRNLFGKGNKQLFLFG